MKTLFTPAIQNGKPITCWVNIPFKFTLGTR
jgi:outer membrane biosynthesis protein TonB